MSCGLGAVILVFMIIKHKVDIAHPETDLLQKELAALTAKEQTLKKKIASEATKNKQAEANITAASNTLATTQKQLEGQKKTTAKQREKLSALKKKIENTPALKKSDAIKDPNIGEENYVIGLRVEGEKIAILLDRSASMTDEKLIDIIRRKNGSNSNKKAGPKWQRTKRILRWLLARLPKNSTVDVVAFNKTARTLSAKGGTPARDQKALERVLHNLDGLVPEGATNLQAGLKAVVPWQPTNIYVITDGLPTDGDSNYRSLNPFAQCSSLWGKTTTISGACRSQLFQHTINSSGIASGVQVNVILLPIQGDPNASSAYWSWTAATGGVLISPAESWP